MSLFDRKTIVDKAHRFNCWKPFSGDFKIGSHDPVGAVDDAISDLADAGTTIVTLGLVDDYSDLDDIGSTVLGDMTGGAVGTSTQEQIDAEVRTAELNNAFEGYGAFRGEVEKAKADHTSISAAGKGKVQADLAASGILKGSAEWNRRLTQVADEYSAIGDSIDEQWTDYTSSTEYGNIVAAYEANWKLDYDYGDLSEEELGLVKPTFDEYYDYTRGTDEQKASMTSIFDMRVENVVNSRTV